MASLSHGHFKENVQGLDLKLLECDTVEDGKVDLFGGDNIICNCLKTASNTDDLLKKAIVKEKSKDIHGSQNHGSQVANEGKKLYLTQYLNQGL